MQWRFKFGVIRRAHGEKEIANESTFLKHEATRKKPKPPRIQVLLQQAYELKKRLDGDRSLTQRALARELGIHPSRVTHILCLLDLPESTQRRIMAMKSCLGRGSLTERSLRLKAARCHSRARNKGWQPKV